MKSAMAMSNKWLGLKVTLGAFGLLALSVVIIIILLKLTA